MHYVAAQHIMLTTVNNIIKTGNFLVSHIHAYYCKTGSWVFPIIYKLLVPIGLSDFIYPQCPFASPFYWFIVMYIIVYVVDMLLASKANFVERILKTRPIRLTHIPHVTQNNWQSLCDLSHWVTTQVLYFLLRCNNVDLW